MVKKAILSGGSLTTDAVAKRVAQQTLAPREAGYVDEVQRLLDAGLAVMLRAGTSSSPRVADIVREAKLSNDAFYRHFASKEDLVAAIVEAGAARLVSYLRHQMAKGRSPQAQLRRWIEGIMAQAGDPEVAEPTRAVLWNGSRTAGLPGGRGDTSHAPLAALLIDPLTALGSDDAVRDASAVVQTVMGRMHELLWQRTEPSQDDIEHLVAYCLAGVRRSGRVR